MTSTLNNYQSSIVLNETLAINGEFPSQDGGLIGMSLAMFHTYAFNFGMTGAPVANGQIINIAQNTALFSLIGFTYGGNGQTTFALPNLAANVAIGDGQGPGLGPVDLGQQLGAATTTLTPAQLPSSLGGLSSTTDEGEPALGVNYLIRVEGIFPSNGGGGSSLGYIGSVVESASNLIPGGYMQCNGQLLDIATNDALFALIGTTYGGDGQTTFALPDLRGRTVVGTGGSHQLGDLFGQSGVTITDANLPANMGGAGVPIDNTEPSIALNYVIALQGIFPNQGAGADPYTPMLGEILTFASNNIPAGFALCQGQLLLISQNQALFSLLGTTYGGNGTTTFALPDLRDNAVAGMGPSAIIGTQLGSDTITLTSADFPDLVYSGTNAAGIHYGGDSNDTINGLGGADIIFGNAGNDTLIGGADADSMIGGIGNDGYYVDDTNDVVSEFSGLLGGIDTIFSSVSFTIAASVERLQLTGTANIDAQGLDAKADTLIGNSGGNILDGKGGNDTMRGGLGNDTYIVDSAGDVVDETTGGGGTSDTIRSSVSYTIAANVEFLQLTGSANINATGLDGKADTLIGNSGDNILDGRGGADTMRGGLGNDTYFVGSTGDIVDEVTGGGGAIDIINASVSYTITNGVERLQLTGTANINATGLDAQADTLIGNSGNNIIDGKGGGDLLRGGLGNDTLTGGTGNDLFRFDTALNAATNMDTITDFNVVNDTIQLENAIFTLLATTGTLADNLFKNLSLGAQDADDLILYDAATGALFYDTNGLTAGGQIQFAMLTGNPAITNADFVVM
jgi:microcystin-dependent protein